LATVASNDFEPVVSERLPVVSDLLLALRSGAVKAGKTLLAGISGSGSAVFAVDLDGLQDGEWLQGILPAGVEAIQTTTATRVEPIIIRH
jgi:4-diphosphocytidyl-2C-methyl-D-erythritol kinase